MTIREPGYSKEEHARRGDDIYKRYVRPQVEAGNQGKIVAIDIDTGAFEVADDVPADSDRLLARYPNAQTWFIRIGHRAVHRLGPRTIPDLNFRRPDLPNWRRIFGSKWAPKTRCGRFEHFEPTDSGTR